LLSLTLWARPGKAAGQQDGMFDRAYDDAPRSRPRR